MLGLKRVCGGVFVRLFFLCWVLMLTACSSSVYAPVTDISASERMPPGGSCRIQPGETLYSVAWRYGLDWRDLAVRNHLQPPFRVRAGQRLSLGRQPVSTASRMSFSHDKKQPRVVAQVGYWHWPVRGKIRELRAAGHGINLAGQVGQAVLATAAGRVVYAGDGLRGYGNLLIIKHNSAWLSAYAWNSRLLVREGDVVRSGQEIAEMGHPARGSAMLHFEIRRNGQPVNPLQYLSRS